MRIAFNLFFLLPFLGFSQGIEIQLFQKIITVEESGNYSIHSEINGENNSFTESYYYISDQSLEQLKHYELYIIKGEKEKKINLKNVLISNLSKSFKSDFKTYQIPIPANSRFRLTTHHEGTQLYLLSKIITNKESVDSIIYKFILPIGMIISTANNDLNFSQISELKDGRKTYTYCGNNSENEEYAFEPICISNQDVKPILAFNNWYLKHLAQVEGVDITTVDRFNLGASDTLQWITELLSFIQDKISYIDFEDGLGAFVPRSAQSTWDNKYGDCKDMGFLFYSILQQNGVKSNLAISRSTNLEKPFDFPAICLANHCFCVAYFGGKTYYLDATDVNCEIGFPSSHTQGCEILIVDEKIRLFTLFH